MLLIVRTKQNIAKVYRDEELIAEFKKKSWVETLKEAETYCYNIKDENRNYI